MNAVDAYTCFLRMLGLKWEPPRYRRIRKLPFIPTENEIDQLIAGSGKKTAPHFAHLLFFIGSSRFPCTYVMPHLNYKNYTFEVA